MTPHLGGHVRAYVDRALPEPMLRALDRHVVCCAMCRALADQERRIVAALRSDTDVPQSLRTSLMGLASTAGPDEVPGVPRPPAGFRMPAPAFQTPVPTVPPQAPALHRSPVRAAVVASLAAGASVAAAWGLAVAPLPAGGPLRAPVARVPAGAATVTPASLGTTLVSPSQRAESAWTLSTRSGPSATWASPGGSTPVRVGFDRSAESRP